MAEDLQDLRDLVAQLQAENEGLRQGASATSNERLVFVPRERKCPMFRGKSGIGLSEWIEEAEACMRARHLCTSDRAFFLFDHLEGEARDEIKYRSTEEREDPAKIIAALQELYGCFDSYVALQEAFFSRRQREGETLQEFSLALMSLMASIKQRAPGEMPNAEVLLRDQFVEQVLDCALRRELKQLVRRQPTASLLEVRCEAIRWEHEGMPGGVRGRSHSLPSVCGIQYGVQGGPPVSVRSPPVPELSELREMLKLQQEQLNQLTQSVSRLQSSNRYGRSPHRGPIVCQRCQQPGHFARECDGVRVPFHPRPSSPAVPQQFGGRSHVPQPPEN